MMENQWIIWVTIAVYVVMMMVIGLANSKSSRGGVANFTVGKRNAGAWLSALSYGTAYFSAVMFIGYSGSTGWNFWLWAVLVGLGNAVFGSWLAWRLLAKRTRNVSHRLKIKSMPQLFYKRFHSTNMKVFSAIVIFLFLTPYSASVYKGLSSVCSVVLKIDEKSSRIPSCSISVGSTSHQDQVYPLHHPKIIFDEAGLCAGAAAYAQVAYSYLTE